MWCVIVTIVAFVFSRISRITSSMISVMIGSSPVFGSSKRRISGWCAMARANPTRRRIPPESSDGRLSSTPSRCTDARGTPGPDRALPGPSGRIAAAGRPRSRRPSSSRTAPLPETTSRTCGAGGCARGRTAPRGRSLRRGPCPESGWIRPIRCFRSTLLPVPDGPTMTSDSPSATEKLTPSRTTFSIRTTCGGPRRRAWRRACRIRPSFRRAASSGRSRRRRIERLPDTTAAVVDRPTPSAPPRVS